LELRRKQLEAEEVRYKQQAAVVADLDRKRAEVEASGMRAETTVRGWNPVASSELTALGAYRLRARKLEEQIKIHRAEAAKKVEEQQKAMLEARRRCRLLERLKERRLVEWTAERDKELEEIAADSYLARWSREM
jgi:hypothetical protein